MLFFTTSFSNEHFFILFISSSPFSFCVSDFKTVYPLPIYPILFISDNNFPLLFYFKHYWIKTELKHGNIWERRWCFGSTFILLREDFLLKVEHFLSYIFWNYKQIKNKKGNQHCILQKQRIWIWKIYGDETNKPNILLIIRSKVINY